MNRLNTQLQRLYGSLPPVPEPEDPGVASACESGIAMGISQVRGLVIELGRPPDWDALRAVWQGVQSDLGWPAPAIAVNGHDAFQLWFSLAEPVGVRGATALLDLLVSRYRLPDTPRRLVLGWVGGPKREGTGLWPLPTPIRHPVGGRWSAFVAPDLARIFSEEPGLDLAPREDAQADLLMGLASVPSEAVQACWPRSGGGQAPADTPPLLPSMPPPTAHRVADTPLGVAPVDANANAVDVAADVARRFLLQVVNDPQADLALRIEAARTLLLAGR